MLNSRENRRVLFVTANRAEVQDLFSEPPLDSWEIVTADSSPAAALLLQTNPCDLLLADDSLYQKEGFDGLAWLSQKKPLPILFLADVPAEVIAEAYERCVSQWLPRRQSWECPQILAGALQRALRWSELQRRQQRTRDSLEQSQRQVDRLVSLLWRTAPMHVERRWYTYRHMLERLEEELFRAERYQSVLTVALGEIQIVHDHNEENQSRVMNWAADEVTQRKRRSDIAGQYGLQGFMLLLAHTPSKGGVICCRRIQKHLESTITEVAGNSKGAIRACFGLATAGGENVTAPRLLRRAEEYLDAAKRSSQEHVIAE